MRLQRQKRIWKRKRAALWKRLPTAWAAENATDTRQGEAGYTQLFCFWLPGTGVRCSVEFVVREPKPMPTVPELFIRRLPSSRRIVLQPHPTEAFCPLALLVCFLILNLFA